MTVNRTIVTLGFGALPVGGGGGAITAPTLVVADLGNGTGATATITASDNGSVTNDIYVGSWGGTSSVTWSLENSRTGNGTASLTLTTGWYWAYVLSSYGDASAASNLVYFVVTDSEESIHMQCAEAAKATIQGLALSGVDNDSVVIRKLSHTRKSEGDTMPMIVLSTHLAVSRTPATNLSDDVTYPVTVGLLASANGDLTSNQERMLMWRQQISHAFDQKRLSGVDRVWKCSVAPSTPFSEMWAILGLKDYSPLTLNFINRELRD